MATISKRGNSWFVQVRRKGFAPRYRSFQRKSEAQQWAREQELAIHSRSAPAACEKRLTLRDLLVRYQREISARKRSAHSEQLRIGKMQQAAIGDLTLEALSPAAVASYRDDRLRLVKPGTVRRELVILHHALEIAAKEWGIFGGINPVGRISRPEVRDQRERRITPNELVQLRKGLAKVRSPYLSKVVEFALATAMRRGEILNLTWDDIEIVTRVATVRQSKNGWARTVPLSEAAMHVLASLDRSSEKIFDTTADAVKNGWERLRSKTGVRDLRFHDLRHEAISQFFEQGLSVAEVCHISGHRDLRMLSRYTHLRAEDIARKMI